ncbi:hypothetical protein [Sphingobacterium bambusae]|uniref:Uncharacterized protein n=1 Tax=Sphingobacterium bambusae TaxID=662858 RepID=A0ABW6BEU6_9SPHI|nr:hypothetical protein [Sphingobacterium bambusae]WPL48760.1 hypothetical protein SCB77_22680 [Sphingobacterium bambusae]
MSEPNSLYLKVHIKPQQREAFLQEAPKAMAADSMWQHWWDSRSMYHKEPLNEIPGYRAPNHDAILQQFLQERSMAWVERYDAQEEQWTLVSLFFSENYTEILPMLNFFKRLEHYVTPESTGLALIYDYYWGSASIMAFMQYRQGRAELTDYVAFQQIPEAIGQAVNQEMDTIVEALQKEFGD